MGSGSAGTAVPWRSCGRSPNQSQTGLVAATAGLTQSCLHILFPWSGRLTLAWNPGSFGRHQDFGWRCCSCPGPALGDLAFHFKPLKARQMGFSHPFAFPIEVPSNDFCKASFACNVQLSSLDCFNTLRAYRPWRALQPTACDRQQPPVPLPNTHLSGGKWASWERGSCRGSHAEALGAVRRVQTWLSHTAHPCHAKDGDAAFKASGCCLPSRPWHQCSVQATFHNSTEEAEGWVRKNRKTVCNLLLILKKKKTTNQEKTGGEDPSFLTQCLDSGEGHW